MSVAQARSRVAVAVKKQKSSGDTEASSAVDDARRELAVEKITQYVERVVASAPELTPEQRSRLAALLRAERVSP